MRKVRLVPDARHEFLKEVTYYEDIRKGLGRRFRTAATAAESEVVVFAVSHLSREPNYWVGRLPNDG